MNIYIIFATGKIVLVEKPNKERRCYAKITHARKETTNIAVEHRFFEFEQTIGIAVKIPSLQHRALVVNRDRGQISALLERTVVDKMSQAFPA